MIVVFTFVGAVFSVVFSALLVGFVLLKFMSETSAKVAIFSATCGYLLGGSSTIFKGDVALIAGSAVGVACLWFILFRKQYAHG